MSSIDYEECLLHFDSLTSFVKFYDVKKKGAEKIKEARNLYKDSKEIDSEIAKVCSAIDKWTSEKELQEGAKYHANCYMKFIAVSLKSLHLILFIEDAQIEDATQFFP